MQDQEREAEDPERVLGPQVAVLDEHVELLREALHGQCGQLVRVGVDVGQVVPGLTVVARGWSASARRPSAAAGAAWR